MKKILEKIKIKFKLNVKIKDYFQIEIEANCG